jgi:hypothetical protein
MDRKRLAVAIVVGILVAVGLFLLLMIFNAPTNLQGSSKEVPVETSPVGARVPDTDTAQGRCGPACKKRRSKVDRPLHWRSKDAPVAISPFIETRLLRGDQCQAKEVEVWADNATGYWMWTYNMKRTVCWQPGSDQFTFNRVVVWTEIGNDVWNIWQDGGTKNDPRHQRGRHEGSGVRWWSIRTYRTMNMCLTFCYADWHVEAEMNFDTAGGYSWQREG